MSYEEFFGEYAENNVPTVNVQEYFRLRPTRGATKNKLPKTKLPASYTAFLNLINILKGTQFIWIATFFNLDVVFHYVWALIRQEAMLLSLAAESGCHKKRNRAKIKNVYIIRFTVTILVTINKTENRFS